MCSRTKPPPSSVFAQSKSFLREISAASAVNLSCSLRALCADRAISVVGLTVVVSVCAVASRAPSAPSIIWTIKSGLCKNPPAEGGLAVPVVIRTQRCATLFVPPAGCASTRIRTSLQRSRHFGSRTGCGEVVQCIEGIWLHPAPIGRRRFRSLFRHSDGWIQIFERRTACGVRGEAGTQGLSG
jgi:hypothetical protein